VVFRSAGAAWVATVRDGAIAEGPLRLSAESHRVGAPAVTVAPDGTVVAAWADRRPQEQAWTVRWARWRHGSAPDLGLAAQGLAESPSMAPSLAALSDGSTLMAWTAGVVRGHVVRAVLLGPDGVPRGAPVDLSEAGENAGSEQIALDSSGRGAVFYLLAGEGGSLELAARPIACGP
jgi:hypothetical protein